MRARVLDQDGGKQGLTVLLAGVASLLLHAAAAGGISTIEARPKVETVWQEMLIAEPPPPPVPVEPEPLPEPEPEPPPPEPPKPAAPRKEVVRFEETTPTPPPPTDAPPPPPDAKPVRRLTFGLSNQSFAEGPSDFGVQVGNTTATKPKAEVMEREEATEQAIVPYQSVTAAPKIERRPMLTVPEEIKAADLSGTVHVELTVGPDGKVTDVKVVSGFHPAAEAACARDVRLSRWKPGSRDGQAVTVTGVPFTCRYAAIEN